MTLYADDMLPYKQIDSYNSYKDLQIDIDLILKWSCDTYMAFNTSKCKQTILTRTHNKSLHHPLRLGDTSLEKVNSYKYLFQPHLDGSHSLCMFES